MTLRFLEDHMVMIPMEPRRQGCSVVVCSGTLSLIAFFALYLGESIMFPTIFLLALRDAGTKTKLASSLLIMTIVGGAVAPVIMGYIADTTGSMAIAFLIPLVCYGVIGTYALSNRHVPH